ncbi:MAG TPA: hypothetical protein VI603_08240 [Saprospiraceae bacterium]|nr:hypothetical protein [Saprospiraceae bacterium]
MNRRHIIPVFWLLSLPLFGQLNLKAGYCLSFLNAPSHDAIIQAHNASLADAYSDPFKPLDLLHGLDLGLEYRWDGIALEAGWRTKRNRQDASGSRSQLTFNNKLNCSLSSFYVGLVQYYRPVRISASVDYNYMRTKLDFEDPSLLTTLKDQAWGSTFSLGFVLSGTGNVSLVLAPYAQFHWTKYDMTQLHDVLTDSPDPPAAEDFFNYGFTLYFLNGPH